ncbi:MAG TPA: anthranilate synthase component I family protein [Bacteroidia bacterium]|jgi:para-aminobenzoate synthetase component 1|nr:anthranilate synthase component I family protein [Bacteroidia bacterium]
MRHLLVLFESKEIKEITPLTEKMPDIKESSENFYCRTNKEEYIETVTKLLTHIKRGDIYEINYCIEFFAENIVINPHKVFTRLKKLTEAPFIGIYQCGDDIILSASPERFLKREGNKLISQPMKGTAPRGKNVADDELLKKNLAKSLKEQTENVMALDVARNDLSVVAKKGTVRTTELFGVQTFKNVHQMISTVECELKEEINFEEIISVTFPPASMTGAPKISACRLIERYELSPRNIYSGCLGMMQENGDFDFCVVIRSIIYNPKQRRISFHVGSAITASSIPETEWEECLLKADALLKALDIDINEVVFLKNKSRLNPV